jgi:glycerophosphoryl diester phosphodiesterase
MMRRIFLITLLSIYIFENAEGATRPVVVGHRGTAYLPELTLATISMAHAFGVDIIEIDVCLSRDNQLIVIHGKNFRLLEINNSNIVFIFI